MSTHPDVPPSAQRPPDVSVDLTGMDWTDDDAIDRLAHEIWRLTVARLTHDTNPLDESPEKESP